MTEQVLLKVRNTLVCQSVVFRSVCEDGALTEQAPGDSRLMHNTDVFGPLNTASADTDPQVAKMVNFLFANSMHGDDYKLICEDDVIKRPKYCYALAQVECNPEV